jgi:uncharacterized protein (TIGR01777 family)
MDLRALDGIEGVVHLAGENIAGGRWSRKRKARILDSRVNGTGVLARALAEAAPGPRVLVCASGVGFYGDAGDSALDETAVSGEGFLADVCRRWEAAARPAAEAGVRVVHLRLGMVFGAGGGALGRMLTPFRMGLGGVLGHGRQYMSWIAMDDVVAAVEHVLNTPALAGPVNVTAPYPVTNEEFTRALGRVLRRPTFLRVPAFALRLRFGRMADELLLAGARVEPVRLQQSGYTFLYPEVEAALRHAVAGLPARTC